MQIQIFFSIIIFTCALALGLSFYALRQRNVPGSRLFAFFALSEGLLALAEILSMISETNQAALFWFNMRIPFLAITPVLWLFFVVQYYQRQSWISKWTILAFCIIPFLTILIQRMPSAIPFWLQQNVSFYQAESFWLVDTSTRIPGFWYYVQTCFSFLLILGSIFLILRDFLKEHIINRSLSVLLAAGSLIFLVISLYPAFFSIEHQSLNPVILGVAVGVLLHVIGIFTLNFLKLPPNAKQKMNVESLKTQERESLNLLVFVFTIIAVSMASLGFLSFNNFQRQYRSQVEAQLTSISLLKVIDIQKWRNERWNDAKGFYENESFSSLIESYEKNPADIHNKEMVQSWLKAYATHDEYVQVFFVNSQETNIITNDDSNIVLPQYFENEIRQILSQGNIFFKDFYRVSEESPVYLALEIPIYATKDRSPLGVVVLQIDPQIYLSPLILRWPVPSQTAETTLVRMENGKVVYLTKLRFLPDAIFTEFSDLSEPDRPSVKAVTGSVGIVEGVNYRGKKVVADVRPILGTPWFLVSRIDQDEIEAPLLERERLSWILYSSLILASAVALNLIWRQQRVRSLITNNKVQSEILERDRKLKEAQELAHLGF